MNKTSNSFQASEKVEIGIHDSLRNLNAMNICRTREIEEWTNIHLIHPLSLQLVKFFIYTRVTPNTASFIGFLFGVLAGSALYHYQNPWMVLVGAIGLFGWHVLDGADGQLARATGKNSDLGKLIDGLCDHATNVLIYVCVTTALATQYGHWVWVPALLAGFSHAIQASAMEFYRHDYDYWVHGKDASRNPSNEEIKSRRKEKSEHRYIDLGYLWYLKMQNVFVGADYELRDRLEKLLITANIDHSKVRTIYRQTNFPVVKKWTLLSTNYRSAILLVACLAGSPLYYLIAEFTLWNGLLIWVRANQTAANNKLNKELDNLDPA